MYKGIIFALLSATLFGITTPLSKTVIDQVAPVTLAGLLYLGSGIGLILWFILRALMFNKKQNTPTKLTKQDFPWLIGAIISGGIIAPVLLMTGLLHTPASTTSLLLNMEGVFTALLAWFVFKENFDKRIFVGMLFIIVAGILLSWDQQLSIGVPWGIIAIISACLFWAIDNNLTCKVSVNDAVQIAGLKGLVAGVVNLFIAQLLGQHFPDISIALVICLIGFFGYGLSLVLFVLALRHLGTARTGAYFSVAPFVGTITALLMLNETSPPIFWLSTFLMGMGILLHLSEKHQHLHKHDPLFHAHSHSHSHDEHHQHVHKFSWNSKEPHSHSHQHESQTHEHQHFPDIHHRHQH